MSIVTPARDFDRDTWKRPLIIPQGGGKPIAYRRCTSYVDVLADKFKLQQWDKRQVAIGLAQRDDLRLSVLAHLDDKTALDRACNDAKEYALASAAATKGTAFHSLTDIVDSGGDLPSGLPENVVRTLEAFREATKALKVVAIEPKSCLDVYRVAGTPDRIYEYNGERYIGDTKTGTIRFGTQKIAAQLAVYARSWLYDVKTGSRTAHDASTSRGIIMDVDLDACTVDLVWIDLEAGWEAVKVAKSVWDQRALDKYDRLTKPFGEPDRPSLRLEIRDEARTAEAVAADRDRIATLIHNCDTADLVRGVWESNAEVWTDDLTTIAREHIAGLQVAS
jgi:hypothetical protein